MSAITITKLRENIFDIFKKVSKGSPITVIWNNKEVGIINPPVKKDWRDNIKIKPKILTKNPMDAFAPLDDVWEGYI